METVDNSFACSHGSLLKNQVKIQYSTVTGQCQRSKQEDRMAVHNDTDFFWSCAVFDGHGGSQISEILADKTSGLLNDLHNKVFLNQEIIKKVYTEYDKNIEGSEKAGRSGSTAVTFTVDVMRQQLFLAHCGDSIGLLIQNNKILHWTVPHDIFLDTEATRIEVAGGFFYSGRVNGKINLTRSFGDYDIVGIDNNGSSCQLIIADPEVFEIRLQQKKPVIGLLCSDGFTDFFCSGMSDLNSQNIEKKILEPLAIIICKLIECGRPISGLAFDLVCLMHWHKSVNKILESIHTNMDWDSIKNESSSWKSSDNVSVVVFEVSDFQDNTSEILNSQQSLTVNDHGVDNQVSQLFADNQKGLSKQNDLNEQERKTGNIDNENGSIIQNNSKTTDDISKDSKKPSSTITKIFNYAKSLISFKRICLGTLGLCLTGYIFKQLYRFKNVL